MDNSVKSKEKTCKEKHSKEEIRKSKKYQELIDIAEVLLEDETNYTLQEADQIIQEFMKGRVKEC